MNMTALLLATAAALADGRAGDSAAAVSATAPPAHSAARAPGSKAVITMPRGLLAATAEVHPWWDGAVYHLATAPERVSDIALQPGETLIAVAAGDTSRWVIGDTVSGSGPTRRTHILVKPAASGLRTNLVITTDRRVYHLELASGGKGMMGIAWTYPQDELIALRRAEAALAAAEPVAGPVAVERLNFNYAIEGDAPPWRPVRAFDDGSQVFIEFSAVLDSTDAPPLFVIGASGRPELVNYRKRGRYYVVDRLFGAAELRLGGKRQQVVRIVRSEGSGQHKRRGRAS
jgi:P-type conjugative transfer protein TrbG